MSPTLRRTPRTAQGYVESLLEVVSEAIPLHMVLIPGGTFIMGSPDDEPDREEREGPQHEVTVPQFFMGRYPVTQAQWKAVTNLAKVERDLEAAPSSSNKGDNYPVERVTWYDAVEFCKRLEQHTGRPYRLPTEAEWEYACRAGTSTPFYFGDQLTKDVANYNGEFKGTTVVDHFGIANAFGLSDMHGNVSEWCQDSLHNSYEGAPVDGSAWTEEGNSSRRIRRGGSWAYPPRWCRSAYRVNNSPGDRNITFGFRVVCSAPRILP